MDTLQKDQRFSLKWEIAEFLIDRQARNCTTNTIKWYQQCLDPWSTFCQARKISTTQDVSSSDIRHYLVHLADNRSPGGVVTLFVGLRAFLNWYALEYAPPGWAPLTRIKAPKRPTELEPPLALSDFQAMVDACLGQSRVHANKGSRTSRR